MYREDEAITLAADLDEPTRKLILSLHDAGRSVLQIHAELALEHGRVVEEGVIEKVVELR